MIQIQIHPSIAPENKDWRFYEIANTLVGIDHPIPSLLPFVLENNPPDQIRSVSPLDHSAFPESLYNGPGWIANQWRQVQCEQGQAGFRLTIPGGGQFYIAPDGKLIYRIDEDHHFPESVLTESVLGPTLILALALQDVWCLHASAAVCGGKVVLFSGESGDGKSTLARHLGMQAGWQRVGDDILPVIHSQDHLYALPRFPQLKIPPEQQPSLGLDARLKIHAIYFLNKKSAQDRVVHAHAMPPTAAALALTRHSVAARLFSKDRMKAHLDFCSWTAQNIPVYELDYPHHYESLEDVQKILEQQLA